MRMRLDAVVLLMAACLGAVGCTTYNPVTGEYEANPAGTSMVAGGLGLAGGVALGAALADDDHYYYGGRYGGWGGGDVDVHNHYNRNVNYKKNTYRKNQYKQGTYRGGGSRSQYRGGGGGARQRGGGGGGRRGGGRRR